MGGKIVGSRSVLIADAAVKYCRVTSIDALEEIPPVIAVAPSATADVVVWSGCIGCVLLVGKSVGIATEVGGCIGTCQVVEVIVTVAVANEVAASGLVLYARVAVSIGFQKFKDAVTAIVDDAVVARIAHGETFQV